VSQLTHRLIRQTIEEADVPHLNRDGTPRTAHVVTYVMTCACGRTFRTGSEIMTQARYLGHLPQPEPGDR
jgi:hypothetical protein